MGLKGFWFWGLEVILALRGSSLGVLFSLFEFK